MWRNLIKTVTVLCISILVISCAKNEEKKPEAKLFGKLSDGQEIYEYTITNDKGMSATIINYGAIVTTLKVADKNGKVEDVIFGFDNLEGYEKDQSFQGAIVGRYGNRIAAGKFTLNGKDYQVSVNSGGNHLHGGV